MGTPINLLSNLTCRCEEAAQPSLLGATDNPTLTYKSGAGNRVSIFSVIGNLCLVKIHVVTTAISKTTTTDPVLVSLPEAAMDLSGISLQCPTLILCMVKSNSSFSGSTSPWATQAKIVDGSSTAELWWDPGIGKPVPFKYSDLGSLSAEIEFILSGTYMVSR